MNILLTLDCSLDCAYCFARACRTEAALQEMPVSELEQITSTLDPCNDPVRLMGGEPTLHSQYPEIMKALKKAQGFSVTVFTNGLQSILRQTLPALPDSILLNLNDWQTYSEIQKVTIQENAAALGDRISLAYTITAPDFDLSAHRRLILDHGLRPVIRLGLAQPVVGGDNGYLPDGDLPAAHQAVVAWADLLARDGIRICLDCGFMRCHFNDTEMETLIRAGAVLNFQCRPTLDIGPGLRVWRCFAFSSGPGVDWRDYQDGGLLRDLFQARDQECRLGRGSCEYASGGWCQGGCLARSMTHQGKASVEAEGLFLRNVGVNTL